MCKNCLKCKSCLDVLGAPSWGTYYVLTKRYNSAEARSMLHFCCKNQWWMDGH